MMDAINLDESFCEQILQTYQKNKSIKVLEIIKNLATAKGENYLSNIYRILIKYSKEKNGILKNNEETNLIVKTKTKSFVLGSEIVDTAFKNEIQMFKEVLPRIEKYINCAVGPFMYSFDENENYIVMEDLKGKGYYMGDQYTGLPFENCLRAMEKMAKFHAGSVAIHEREPLLLKEYDGISGLRPISGNYFRMMKHSLSKITKSIEETWKEDEYQEIACKLKKLINELQPRLNAAFEHDADEFCVLNHGDCWVNNVMFKNDNEGKPCDALMIDFQVISYTSPAIDLQHFLAMCPELELKGVKEDCFLETYLTVLKNTMQKIGCKTNPPTMEQLKKAMKKRGIYSVLTGLIYHPGMLANKNEMKSFSNLATELPDVDYFKEPFAKQTVHKAVKVFNNKGYLEY